MTQSIQQTDSRAQKWPPLVCICSLCECGGHKCSDFNDRPLERNGNNSTTPLGDDGGNYDERLCRSQSHSCSYTQGAAGQLEERYLTRTGAPPGQQQRKQQQQQQHLSRPKRSPSVGDDARNDSSKGKRATPVSSRASQTGPGLEDEADVLHVLVTRPQVASKPRDNIIFEGDMDLRTTFETSYEALARARLEHWKRHQELKARRQRLETPDERRRQDVSDIMAGNDSRQQAATTFSRGNEEAGFEGRSSSLAGQQLRGARVARDDDYDDDDHDADRHYGRTMGGAQFVSDVEGRGAAGFAGFGAGFGGAGAHNHDHGGGPIDSRELDPLRNTYGTARNKRAAPANVSTINAPNNRNVSGAADQSAESKQQRRPLVFGPALSLETADPGGRRRQAAGSTSPNQPELAPLTTGQRKQQQHRRQQDHFIDPDLSPIIVYDANLNRLERVGLRKRSKYRPSTSLRPGGGGFFGPVDDGGEGANKSGSGPGGAAATPDPGKQIKPDDRCHERAAREKRGANSRLELADQNRPENEGLERAHEEEEAVTADDGPLEGRHHQHHDETTRAAAGATSETLNRAQNDCGRKHHLAHVNRIDHIKQMNLVEGSHSPELTTTTTTKSGGGGDNTQLAGWQGDNNETEAVDNRRARLKLTENGHGQHRTTNTDYDDHEDHDHDRRLAFEEEEAAAVAEIQRLVVDDSGEYRVAHRVEPSHLAGDGTGQRAPSRQSPTNKFIRQTTIASPSEAALVSRAQDNSPALPGKVSADGRRSSSRHSRMERVCQNQSFYLFENDYPETRNGALDDKRCIKIGGGRESVELAKRTQHGPAAVSPQSAHVRQNLFRESPDFIMTTTGHTRARLLKSGQENENSEDNKGYDGQRDQRQQFNATPEHNDAQVQRQQQHAEANILNQISDQFFDRGGTGATGSPGDHPCRVLNLRNEFEFVGSRSGHKYFVEKHRLASPLGEVG